ncbi:hypothetical protein NLG97_g10774 [Lecanicillium saksenae]|uniref:Uncharacterized protein n=1 Tax=Lecanicillium saksenae TaxID=468837 RepID=A0ACC1QDN3_9HYPO|nr:hypothetical protein NLG97_g10774 [Lecanicillium saksenae]
MKAVVFGTTGLVGSAVLNACIANAKITKIYVVTRRPLGDEREKNPKVETILHSDMAQYPPELLEKLKGIELCFWYAMRPQPSPHCCAEVLTRSH